MMIDRTIYCNSYKTEELTPDLLLINLLLIIVSWLSEKKFVKRSALNAITEIDSCLTDILSMQTVINSIKEKKYLEY